MHVNKLNQQSSFVLYISNSSLIRVTYQKLFKSIEFQLLLYIDAVNN